MVSPILPYVSPPSIPLCSAGEACSSPCDIRIDEATLIDRADFIPEIGLTVLTTNNQLVSIQNEHIIWSHPIQRFLTEVFVVPFTQQIVVSTVENLLILDAVSGATTLERRVNRDREICSCINKDSIVLTTNREKKSICSYSLKDLSLQWEIEVEERPLNCLSLSEKAVISFKNRTIVVNEHGQTNEFINKKDQTTFRTHKASEHHLLLVDGYYLLDILSGEKIDFNIRDEEPLLIGTPKILTKKNIFFNGLVSKQRPEHQGYGIYRYPLAIFDEQGNLASKKIYFNDRIHHIAIDSSQNIIVSSGPSIESWEKYGEFTRLKCHISIYNMHGEKLDQIELSHPVHSAIHITPEDDICFFSDNKWCVRKNLYKT